MDFEKPKKKNTGINDRGTIPSPEYTINDVHMHLEETFIAKSTDKDSV